MTPQAQRSLAETAWSMKGHSNKALQARQALDSAIQPALEDVDSFDRYDRYAVPPSLIGQGYTRQIPRRSEKRHPYSGRRRPYSPSR